jgi:oxygen-independent coproporphyrinogen-3 oxidase
MSGIYIHIPFCKQKCTYCDFHFSTTFGSYRSKMISALCSELAQRKHELTSAPETLYFGGGTPSLLHHSELDQLFETLHNHYDLSNIKEQTLEANPDDIHSENLCHWKKLGINRLSIGLQSFKESDLQWMRRAHTTADGLSSIQLAQAHGFEALSVDLMYGLPNLSMTDWIEHIQKVVSMGVTHVSAYCLTVEAKTELNTLIKKEKIAICGEDQQSEQFEMLSQMLISSGFDHYEISNFGKPGKHSLHNSNYWKGAPYIGIGPSAHSFNGIQRRWNIANNALYLRMKSTEWYETETLGAKERWNELIMMGLRTSYGVNRDKLFKILPPDPYFIKKIHTFVEAGWMIEENVHLFLTTNGRLKADYIASELFK